jgi:uncharacterized protein YciW
MSAGPPPGSSCEEPWSVDATPSPLTELESLLAAYAASTSAGSTCWSAEILSRLAELGAPRALLENIRSAAGRWTVSDDDRIEVLVAYAAKLSRAPGEIDDGDVERLAAVGFTEFEIVDLNNIVAYYC